MNFPGNVHLPITNLLIDQENLFFTYGRHLRIVEKENIENKKFEGKIFDFEQINLLRDVGDGLGISGGNEFVIFNKSSYQIDNYLYLNDNILDFSNYVTQNENETALSQSNKIILLNSSGDVWGIKGKNYEEKKKLLNVKKSCLLCGKVKVKNEKIYVILGTVMGDVELGEIIVEGDEFILRNLLKLNNLDCSVFSVDLFINESIIAVATGRNIERWEYDIKIEKLICHYRIENKENDVRTINCILSDSFLIISDENGKLSILDSFGDSLFSNYNCLNCRQNGNGNCLEEKRFISKTGNFIRSFCLSNGILFCGDMSGNIKRIEIERMFLHDNKSIMNIKSPNGRYELIRILKNESGNLRIIGGSNKSQFVDIFNDKLEFHSRLELPFRPICTRTFQQLIYVSNQFDQVMEMELNGNNKIFYKFHCVQFEAGKIQIKNVEIVESGKMCINFIRFDKSINESFCFLINLNEKNDGMISFRFSNDHKSVRKVSCNGIEHFLQLPKSKFSWMSTIKMVSLSQKFLIIGTRYGHLLYYQLSINKDVDMEIKGIEPLVKYCRRLPNREGVTDIDVRTINHSTRLIYSSYRSGLIFIDLLREFINDSYQIESIRSVKLGEWIGKIILEPLPVSDECYMIDDYMKCLNFESSQLLLKNDRNEIVDHVPCSNGHRSWQFVSLNEQHQFFFYSLLHSNLQIQILNDKSSGKRDFQLSRKINAMESFLFQSDEIVILGSESGSLIFLIYEQCQIKRIYQINDHLGEIKCVITFKYNDAQYICSGGSKGEIFLYKFFRISNFFLIQSIDNFRFKSQTNDDIRIQFLHFFNDHIYVCLTNGELHRIKMNDKWKLDGMISFLWKHSVSISSVIVHTSLSIFSDVKGYVNVLNNINSVKSFKIHQNAITSLLIKETDKSKIKFLSSGDDGNINLSSFHLLSNQLTKLFQLNIHHSTITDFKLFHNQKIISIGLDDRIHLIQLKENDHLRMEQTKITDVADSSSFILRKQIPFILIGGIASRVNPQISLLRMSGDSFHLKFGKDVVHFLSTTELQQSPTVVFKHENEMETPAGLVRPDGSINWGCPCLGTISSGPCAEEFREAFTCFHLSADENKGVNCLENFEKLRKCTDRYPNLYPDKPKTEKKSEFPL
ncbi:hypothetical protein SNEBB_006360 [Seison nebaliae]|nr:hypothetical protein SNEBB_006360 [Seison nebaliae]